MKYIVAVASLSILFGCGIMSVIFGMSERYIERDVSIEEMIGTWNITSKSEADVKEFLKKFPGWGSSAPWKTITLNKDGSCAVKLEIDWLQDVNALPTEFPRQPYPNGVVTNHITSCSWKLAKDKNLSDKISPVIEFDFEYPDNYGMLYSLYIYEENGKLIIWTLIGDPDDFWPQDFVKVGQ